MISTFLQTGIFLPTGIDGPQIKANSRSFQNVSGENGFSSMKKKMPELLLCLTSLPFSLKPTPIRFHLHGSTTTAHQSAMLMVKIKLLSYWHIKQHLTQLVTSSTLVHFLHLAPQTLHYCSFSPSFNTFSSQSLCVVPSLLPDLNIADTQVLVLVSLFTFFFTLTLFAISSHLMALTTICVTDDF